MSLGHFKYCNYSAACPVCENEQFRRINISERLNGSSSVWELTVGAGSLTSVKNNRGVGVGGVIVRNSGLWPPREGLKQQHLLQGAPGKYLDKALRAGSREMRQASWEWRPSETLPRDGVRLSQPQPPDSSMVQGGSIWGRTLFPGGVQ